MSLTEKARAWHFWLSAIIGIVAALMASTWAVAKYGSGLASASDVHSLEHRVTIQEAHREDDHEAIGRIDTKTDALLENVAEIKEAVKSLRGRR